MNTFKTLLAGTALLSATMASTMAFAIDTVTVAYFLEWPTPNQVAQIEETFDKEMGVKVSWKAFGNGNEMSAAMASGGVQIAYSQGLVPFVIAVTKGLKIKTVGVAVEYADADNCVVSAESGITKANAKELEGKKVGTPIGNVTHYKLLKTLEHLGVDASKVNMVPMNGNEAAAAMERGDITMGCAFGGALERMKTKGSVLLTGAEQGAAGIQTFDVISVTNKFADEHPDLLAKFLEITERANMAYASDPASKMATLQKASGLDEAKAKALLGAFSFPTVDEQLGKDWMGGTVASFSKGVADFYVKNGELPKALDDYSATVDASFLEKAKMMMK